MSRLRHFLLLDVMKIKFLKSFIFLPFMFSFNYYQDFNAIINVILKLLYSICSSWRKNTFDFGVFHFAQLTYSNNFAVTPLDFIPLVILFMSNNSFTCFSIVDMVFIFSLSRTSSTVLKGSDDKDHFRIAQSQREGFKIFTTKYDVCCRIFVDALWVNFSFYSWISKNCY